MIPMFDPAGTDAALAGEIRAAVDRVARSGQYVLGPEVAAFEQQLARFIGVDHAVGVSSGSDALVCALLAVGVGPGDEVIVPALSFFATAEAVVRTGAIPRFTDINPRTFNMEPALVEAAVGERTRAILPVHLYGQPAPMDAIRAIAARHGVPVIEDAAQAIGAAWQGRRVGAWGALGCFSFFPSKPLGGWGDGGMVVTNDAELADRCRRIRAHGSTGKHEHSMVGGNFRLDAIQAAVLAAKLPHLEGWLSVRRGIAAAYTAELRGVATPAVADGAAHAWALYTIRSQRRDALARHLHERGVASAVHYPKPLYAQPALAYLGVPAGACPEAERATREVLSIPLYPGLSDEARRAVVEAITRPDAGSAAR